MSASITIQLPEEILIEALRQLSPERRHQLLQQIGAEAPRVVTLPAESLRQITGIIEIGGDALVESDQIYDE